MDEKKIPQFLCEYLNGAGVCVFMPEVWRDECGAVLLGETTHRKDFVNGSAEISLKFEVAVRTTGHSASERLETIESLAKLAEYVGNNPPKNAELKIVPIDGPKLYGIYKDCAEYHSTYEMRYTKVRGASGNY